MCVNVGEDGEQRPEARVRGTELPKNAGSRGVGTGRVTKEASNALWEIQSVHMGCPHDGPGGKW